MNKFNLNDDDVVSMDAGASLNRTSTSTCEELISRLQGYIRGNLGDVIASDWCNDGVICRILQVKGGGWQTGKVRIRIEFIPDQPTDISPLDDLRNNL